MTQNLKVDLHEFSLTSMQEITTYKFWNYKNVKKLFIFNFEGNKIFSFEISFRLIFRATKKQMIACFFAIRNFWMIA